MKRLLLATAIAALMLSPAAFAGDHGHGGGDHGDKHGHGDRMEQSDRGHGDERGDQGDDRMERHGHSRHDIRTFARDDERGDERGPEWRRQGRHDNGLHLGQRKQAWARGQRISRSYLEPRYYVNDYSAYHLAPPPQGMVWVRPYQDSRRFYLVQLATGLISRILGR